MNNELATPIHESNGPMKYYTVAALVLIVAGVFALVYGKLTYTKDSDTVELGPIELTVKEKETVNLPVWLGAGAIVVGGAMMAVPLLKR